jgi:hypothetical protein
MPRVLTNTYATFFHRKVALLIKVSLGTAALAWSSFAAAQPSVLVEACNGLKNAAKKAQCLKQAGVTTASDNKPTLTSTKAKIEAVVPFTLDVAVTACETVMKGVVKRHSDAIEDTTASTDQAFAVTWPGIDGKAANYCSVDRQSRTIVSIGKGDKAFSGERLAKLIAESEATAKMLDEIKAGNYGSFVQYAKTALSADFKDPSSAQYRGMFLSGEALPVLCGEVNAKNSYGAYVGFRRFYATGKPLLNSVETAKSDYVFEQMWPSMCGEKKAAIDNI